MRVVERAGRLVGALEQLELVPARRLQRRAIDLVEVRQRHRPDGHRPWRRATRGDLPGGAGGLAHARLGQLLGVGVPGRVALQDAHAQAEHDALAHRAHPPLLEHEVGSGSVLEVQIRVVAARPQRLRQQPLGHRHVDAVEGADHCLAHADIMTRPNVACLPACLSPPRASGQLAHPQSVVFPGHPGVDGVGQSGPGGDWIAGGASVQQGELADVLPDDHGPLARTERAQ